MGLLTELRRHIQGMSLSNKSALPMTCLTVLSQSKHEEVGEAAEKKRMLCQFVFSKLKFGSNAYCYSLKDGFVK